MKKMQDSSTTETKKTLKSYQFTKINMKMRSIHYQKLKKKRMGTDSTMPELT